MAPADDDVAAGGWMAVVAEIAALEFKFDEDALPAFGTDQAHGLAVGKLLLNDFDYVAQFFCQHSKEEDDTLFVHRFVAQPKKICGIAIGGAALEPGAACFTWRNFGRRVVDGASPMPVGLRYGAARCGRGKKGEDIRPLRLVFGEIAKGLGQS